MRNTHFLHYAPDDLCKVVKMISTTIVSVENFNLKQFNDLITSTRKNWLYGRFIHVERTIVIAFLPFSCLRSNIHRAYIEREYMQIHTTSL